MQVQVVGKLRVLDAGRCCLSTAPMRFVPIPTEPSDATGARSMTQAEQTMPDAAEFDPASLDPVRLAAALVGLDTSHDGEGGNTLPLAQFLADIWQRAGVPTKILDTPKANNAHFLARVRGTGLHRPLLVLCHSDVVTADPSRWRTDPFTPEIRDGYLWGRGSLDMKGALAAFMTAILGHVTSGAVFDRDIVFLSDCDEEGGWYSTRWVLERHGDRAAVEAITDVEAVITEGGWTLAQQDGRTPMLASMTCQERVFGVIRLTANGTTTHSSRPTAQSAIARLAKVVSRVEKFQPPVVLTELNRNYFHALGESTADPRLRDAVRALLVAGDSDAVTAAAEEVVLASSYPWLHNAMLRATIAFVVQDGGLRANVVPGRASVLLQVRFTPQGQPPQQLIDQIRQLVSDDVELSIVGHPGETTAATLARWERDAAVTPASVDTDVFAAWQRAARETYPEASAVPAMFEAATSGKPWREKEIPVYGVYPYVVDNETITAMHGDGERVGVAELRRGTELLERMFRQFIVT